jgi:hypothetical protein
VNDPRKLEKKNARIVVVLDALTLALLVFAAGLSLYLVL